MDFKKINELAVEVHKNAVEHGFWEGNPSDEHCLCLVISELMEAVEADRKGRHANLEAFKKSLKEYHKINSQNEIVKKLRLKEDFECYIKQTIEDEISDAFIRLLDLAGAKGITLERDSRVYYWVTSEKSFTENIFEIVKIMATRDTADYLYLNCCFKNIMGLAEILGFDLEYHVRLKMRYNALREYKHGKAY